MAYKLTKPYSEQEKQKFIVMYDHRQRLQTEETATALYALEAWEKLEGDEVIDNTEEYEQQQIKERQEQFETEFFNTSLGYIRRKVTMANGDIKDFLTDLLPSIAMGIQLNQPVSIIAYKEPDFTEEFTDLVKYQEIKQATAEFIQECFMQLNNDFMPSKVEEDLNSGEKPIDSDEAVVEK